ncbi:MAG: hypothetical protein M1355_04295 [Patescibacteria group bacterium]|nr:hypothetical protein [Patescibacteria group bacterium]
MSNTIDYIYTNFLYNPFIYVVRIFVNERYGVFILFGIIVVLSMIQGKLVPKLSQKIKFLPQLFNFVIVVTAILAIAVSFFKYGPNIDELFKSIGITNTETPTPTQQNNSNSGTKKTPSQPSTPSYQAPKQLYYSVSCSSCWNQGCNHNGYSYGGYLESYYIYYKNLCQSCSCNNSRSQSFYR